MNVVDFLASTVVALYLQKVIGLPHSTNTSETSSCRCLNMFVDVCDGILPFIIWLMLIGHVETLYSHCNNLFTCNVSCDFARNYACVTAGAS